MYIRRARGASSREGPTRELLRCRPRGPGVENSRRRLLADHIGQQAKPRRIGMPLAPGALDVSYREASGVLHPSKIVVDWHHATDISERRTPQHKNMALLGLTRSQRDPDFPVESEVSVQLGAEVSGDEMGSVIPPVAPPCRGRDEGGLLGIRKMRHGDDAPPLIVNVAISSAKQCAQSERRHLRPIFFGERSENESDLAIRGVRATRVEVDAVGRSQAPFSRSGAGTLVAEQDLAVPKHVIGFLRLARICAGHDHTYEGKLRNERDRCRERLVVGVFSGSIHAPQGGESRLYCHATGDGTRLRPAGEGPPSPCMTCYPRCFPGLRARSRRP